jgi:threonine dehydrogenase-like Zn-dependent dehydrogenase
VSAPDRDAPAVTAGPDHDCDHDVVVVGGGPAGCSAAVFTARYGLDTVVFDRGRSSLRRCGYLENYLGFPAGIDVDAMYDRMHDHVAEAGGTLVADLVESVARTADGEGFVVTPEEGDPVTAARVVAAARYDGEYLRPLGDDGMFETYEHDGEEDEAFDRSYSGETGETPIDGLYVASPSAATDRQAVVAAGRGARVGLRLVDDVRREQGFFEEFVEHRDWVRRAETLTGEWADPDRWREYADDRRPDDHDLDDDRWVALRDREIERRLETYLTDEELDRRAERGRRRRIERMDDDLVLERAREIAAERGAPEVAPDPGGDSVPDAD